MRHFLCKKAPQRRELIEVRLEKAIFRVGQRRLPKHTRIETPPSRIYKPSPALQRFLVPTFTYQKVSCLYTPQSSHSFQLLNPTCSALVPSFSSPPQWACSPRHRSSSATWRSRLVSVMFSCLYADISDPILFDQIPKSCSSPPPSSISRMLSTTKVSTSSTRQRLRPLATRHGSVLASSKSSSTKRRTSSSFPRLSALLLLSPARTTCESCSSFQVVWVTDDKSIARTTTHSHSRPSPWPSRPSAHPLTWAPPSSSRTRTP